jgi:hypothetical protein
MRVGNMELIGDILKRLENVAVACIVCFIILFFAGLLIPSIWAFIFSVIFSFVTSDLILNGFIHGGEGHAKIFSKNAFAHKGHAYVVFLIGIIVSTVLSSLLADIVFQGYQQNSSWVQTVFFSDFFAVLFVFIDLAWRFYEPNKNR